ncbi:MAG TPA: hypothetical protein VKA50_01290 [Gammaproteobacteria bacterium]|nr:hypothetical protein [Gammaproteobacteria bacterium]
MPKKSRLAIEADIEVKRARYARWAPEASAEIRRAAPWAWRVQAGDNTITGLSRSEEEATKNARAAAQKLGGGKQKSKRRMGIDLGTANSRATAL